MIPMNTNIRSNWLIFLAICSFMPACNSDPIAKPRGYFRIEIPAAEYTSYHHPCGPTFDVPVYAKVERIPTDARNDDCWFNLAYPLFSAKLHCTLVRFEGNPAFYALIDDVHEMVFSHESKSTGIQSHAFEFPTSQVNGLVFDLAGPVATPLQFFATDSTQYFLRGALYFQHAPNPDSIGPALDHLRIDIIRMIESLQWTKP
jgi:gliding motility-associated lipoprotein GldD